MFNDDEIADLRVVKANVEQLGNLGFSENEPGLPGTELMLHTTAPHYDSPLDLAITTAQEPELALFFCTTLVAMRGAFLALCEEHGL